LQRAAGLFGSRWDAVRDDFPGKLLGFYEGFDGDLTINHGLNQWWFHDELAIKNRVSFRTVSPQCWRMNPAMGLKSDVFFQPRSIMGL
jgi:hypothetical protein